MSIVYMKSGGINDTNIGKYEYPIKMVIEHESDLLTKKGGIRDWLFNVEKSNRFGEAIVGEDEFDVFQASAEGAGAESDTVNTTNKKFIEHVQFMKEFVVTAEMMEDANYGVGAEARRRAENFTRAYYKTQHKLAEQALIDGISASSTFARASIDLTTADTHPLFYKAHTYGSDRRAGSSGTQSNYFYDGSLFDTTAHAEETLGTLASKIRNMKDENGDPLGYTADTLILPGNRPGLETIIKKVCGSDGSLGNGYNDINIQRGNWNIIVLPDWQASADEIMVMSSEANKQLSGNMFFNRIPLTVRNWVDNHTANYCWMGRCRFGVGFGSYKHILRCKQSTDEVTGASELNPSAS